MSTEEDNICSNPAYINSLDQKNRFRLFHIPPTRYNNLLTNPYYDTAGNPLYKRFDLDMRRKAQVLQYSNNVSSTKTNNLTKKQKFALLIQQTKNTPLQTQPIVCPMVKTPSTSSNVPGPAILLYQDPSIPLYNYQFDHENAYGIINQQENPYKIPWDYTKPTNLLNSSIFSTLYIVSVDYTSRVFSITTPISMHLDASCNQAITTTSNSIKTWISNIELVVKYSYSNVTLSFSPTISFDHSSITTNPIIITTTNSGLTHIHAQVYLGIVTISNIPLYVQNGYIYDFQLNISMNYLLTQDPNNPINLPQIITCMNVTKDTVTIPPVGCTVSGASVIPSTFPEITIV